MSHLLQMRGLKRILKDKIKDLQQSHLLQMRGLKRTFALQRIEPIVASFTDAWIETYFRRREQYLKSRIFYRCVD